MLLEIESFLPILKFGDLSLLCLFDGSSGAGIGSMATGGAELITFFVTLAATGVVSSIFIFVGSSIFSFVGSSILFFVTSSIFLFVVSSIFFFVTSSIFFYVESFDYYRYKA